MPDLSIIVPVYNTPQAALRRCFDSIKALQEIRWETIVIDDGSRKETGTFCENYCKENQGFSYFPKENGGVSTARNLGIDKARGKYVMFVDADDCLLPEAVLPEQVHSDADFVIFDMDVVQQGVRTTWKALEQPAGMADRAQVLRRYLCTHALNGPVAKLFKRECLQSSRLRFDESFVTGEDWLFGSRFALLAKTILYVPVASYLYYRDGSTSLSRLTRFPDAMLDNLIAMYHEKLRMVQTEFSDAPDKARMQAIASAAVVENAFNCAADLYRLKKQTPARKERIVQVCRQAMTYLGAGSAKKSRIKAWLVIHLWVGIYPVAHLRALYLKVKK